MTVNLRRLAAALALAAALVGGAAHGLAHHHPQPVAGGFDWDVTAPSTPPTR